MEIGGAHARGNDLLLRYLYNDGTLQAALPLRGILDTVLDLWIGPDCTALWKDEDEAAAALETPHLSSDNYQVARDTGEALIEGLQDWHATLSSTSWSSKRAHDCSRETTPTFPSPEPGFATFRMGRTW